MSRLSIGQRVFLTFMITVILIVGVILIGQRHAFRTSFLNYTAAAASDRLGPLRDELADAYINDDGWDFIRGETTWSPDYMQVLFPFRGGSDDDRAGSGFPPGRADRRGQLQQLPAADRRRLRGTKPGAFRPPLETLSLTDKDGEWIAGAPLSARTVNVEIVVEGLAVGYLALAVPEQINSELDLAFFNQQVRFALIFGLVALCMSAFAAAVLSRSFSKPIRILAGHVTDLTRGDYHVRRPPTRRDEIGDLMQGINALAERLGQTRARQRAWVADTSHELRTPVTILLAELESIQDGLRPMDASSLASFESELHRLKVLVEDLHQLAASDSDRLFLNVQEFDLGDVLNAGLDAYRTRFEAAGIKLDDTRRTVADESDPVLVRGDAARIRQVIDNLLENALRYTDQDGTLRISLAHLPHAAELKFEDSPPGVPGAALERLFDRFYRVEGSRNRTTGAAGLGLAICDSIMKAHGGTIAASPSELGGLALTLEFPRNGPQVSS